MNSRSILFIGFLMASLFCVNLFFNKGSTPAPTQTTQVPSQQESSAIAKRTLDAASLPLVALYSDEDATVFLNDALLVDNNILTLSWQNDIPPTIYFKSPDSAALQSATLLQKSIEVGGPLLYQAAGQNKINAIQLSDTGSYDLQLLTMKAGDTSPQVSLGEYREGYFSTPLHAPQTNAIALVKTEQGMQPAGVYLANSKSLISLDHFLGFKDYIDLNPLLSSREKTHTQEKFYVLENDYQQLVFSNLGGALKEINLPLQNRDNPNSVVKEIEFDTKMATDHPYNSHFPEFPYFLPSITKSDAPVEKTATATSGYYPLLRRDLVEPLNKKSIKIPPRFYALNIVSDYHETAELVYDVKYFDKQKIVFETVQNHRKITKTFSLGDQTAGLPYCIDLKIDLEGDSRGLWLTSGIPEVELISGSSVPNLKYRTSKNLQKAEIESVSLPKTDMANRSIEPEWMSNSNGFFSIIVNPLNQIGSGFKAERIDAHNVPTRILEIDRSYDKYKASSFPGYEFQLPLRSDGGSMEFRIFAGPLETNLLKSIDTSVSAFTANPEYIKAQTSHGFFQSISEPFSKLLSFLMNFFYLMTGSWGFSIILLTIALRLMLYPLNAWSIKSMRKMKDISPEIKAIQERHKKDPKKAQIEMMKLYKTRKANPFLGCLPMLIQMPFLFGMFDLLKSTFSLRGASFIPGWINNLTAPDVLFSWKAPFFFIGNEFHLLPLLLGVIFYVQQKVSMPLPKDKSLMTDQQKQQKMMSNIMLIAFAFMFYNLPSGLNIYMIFSMLLGIIQQWITNRMLDKKKKQETELEIITPQTGKKSKKKQKLKA